MHIVRVPLLLRRANLWRSLATVSRDLRYTPTHEYVRWVPAPVGCPKQVARVGISNHAASLLGESVFVDLPNQGATLRKGELLANIESVKVAEDVFCPVDGVVTRVNMALKEEPSILSEDPEKGGWIAEVTVEVDSDHLLEPDEYMKMLEEKESGMAG